MIPCQEDKCLKFPICKNQRTIFCTPLYDYLYAKIVNQDEGYSILTNLIDCYRDKVDLTRSYIVDIKDASPIINAKRLMDKIEEDN
jgi:hypothetical protein